MFQVNKTRIMLNFRVDFLCIIALKTNLTLSYVSWPIVIKLFTTVIYLCS
jgi:hypothetical protein